MKKIGIITVCGNNNYGNKLQNYALQTVLEKKGFAVNSLWIDCMHYCNKCKQIMKVIYKDIHSIFCKREKNFIKFNKEFIKYYKKRIIFTEQLHKEEKKFDFFIVGSDQVWNYGHVNNFDIFLLKGINQIKKISYAASFGVEIIPQNLKRTYIDGLKDFKCISTREDKGQEIVKEITGRKDTEVLVDPTMLLTAKEWDKVSKKPEMLKTTKYILNYFLGELSNERKSEIERIAKDHECEIINILDKKSPFYECGPSEFLYLEKNAFLVCTDSFHSSVFAILYNTPFLVFDREDKIESMNSRIETLLSKFNLEDRKYKGKITSKDLKANYSEAYKILEKEREKSKKYLEKALNQED